MTTPLVPRMPTGPAGISPLGHVGGGLRSGATADDSFGNLLNRALGDVSDAQQHKDDVIGAFLRGEPVELHDVMAAAEEATLSLDMLVETRNKLTDAYRAVMNMQV